MTYTIFLFFPPSVPTQQLSLGSARRKARKRVARKALSSAQCYRRLWGAALSPLRPRHATDAEKPRQWPYWPAQGACKLARGSVALAGAGQEVACPVDESVVAYRTVAAGSVLKGVYDVVEK